MLNEETKDRIKKHLVEHFPDENIHDVHEKMNYMLSHCFSSYEDGFSCVALQPLGGKVCLVFREDTGEFAGIQPWDFVQEKWEEV